MREITIDSDTVVGYDYELKSFYITNKETTTYRPTNKEAKDVLDIVAPDNTVSLNDLTSLASTLEELTKLYYTWEDTGSYIKTIQLNDYNKYPLCLDAEKRKIYIMNTHIIFDLTLNEGERERLLQLQSFYKDTLGIFVELTDLRILYRLLVAFYKPTCYNQIEAPQEDTQQQEYTLRYSDTLKLSNYRQSSPATYSLQINPYKQYNYTTIGSITNITDNVITLASTVPQQVTIGSTINVKNASTTIDTTTYSADGSYIVQDVQGNKIYTTENLSANFSVTLPTLNIVAYKNYIRKIDRDEQTITLTNSARDFLIGDTIVLKDVTVQTPYETLSLDGFYSIIGIEDNILYVDEVPLTDYETTSNTGYVYKPIPALTVTAINNETITVAEATFPSTLTVNTPIVIYTTIAGQEGTTYMQYSTVSQLKQAQKQVVVTTTLTDNVPKFGQLREPTPYTNVLTIVENSKSSVLPNGSFMLDTHEQAIEYLSLLSTLVVPTDTPLTPTENNTGNINSCNTQVRDYYIIDETSTGISTMELLGLYSKVYAE